METATLLEILDDWNFWRKDRPTGIPRPAYGEHLLKLIRTSQVVTIVGIRRSGKSTIMLQLIRKLIEKGENPKNILYVNFEDVRFTEPNIALLNKIYDVYMTTLHPTGTPTILLDEVQKVTGWERFARTMHELKKAHVVVSGSTSKVLVSTLASVLTGRHIDMRVFPLDFSEYLSFNNLQPSTPLDIAAQRHTIKSLLSSYLEYGGFPLVCLQEQKKEILQTYVEDIMTRDVIENHTIEQAAKLKALAKLYLSNAGRRVSFNNLAKTLGLSLDTVERYSWYLEEAYLIHFMKKFSPSVKEQEATMNVVYAADNGLRTALGFSLSRDAGWVYQNAVAVHLLKIHGKENVFYWMSDTKQEVDFVVLRKRKPAQLIQVCYTLGHPETKAREFKALVKAAKELRCRNLLIITEDNEGSERYKGYTIQFVPLWRWLLEKS